MAGPPTSIQRSHLIYRPISEDGFAVDVLLGNKSPHAAVVGLIPVVAENVVVARLNINRRVRTMIHEFGQDVVFSQRLVIDVNSSALYFHDITGHSDDAFDVR